MIVKKISTGIATTHSDPMHKMGEGRIDRVEGTDLIRMEFQRTGNDRYLSVCMTTAMALEFINVLSKVVDKNPSNDRFTLNEACALWGIEQKDINYVSAELDAKLWENDITGEMVLSR